MEESQVSWIEKVGGRKMVMAVVVLVGAGAYVALKGDLPTNLKDLIQTIFGAFVAGNAVEHIRGAVAERAEAASTPEPAPKTDVPAPDMMVALNTIYTEIKQTQTHISAVAEATQVNQKALEAILKRG